jgi:hypothetical protein
MAVVVNIIENQVANKSCVVENPLFSDRYPGFHLNQAALENHMSAEHAR